MCAARNTAPLSPNGAASGSCSAAISAAAKPHGPFWLIVNSLGGPALGAALGMLQPNGTCVTLGVSEAATATFESRDFFRHRRRPALRPHPVPRIDERRARRHRPRVSWPS